MKKKTASLLCIVAIIFSGCQNTSESTSHALGEIVETETQQTNTTLDYVREAERLNDFLAQYEEPIQTFKISGSKFGKVVGKQGTIIHIKPSSLETMDGNPVGAVIEVELKEQTNQGQLLRGNTQTVSNGQLLVSGGAYYINMTSDGEQLRLKKGKTMNVEFPKVTEEEMYLFYGQRDSLGQMNWTKVNRKFEKRQPQVAVTDVLVIEYYYEGRIKEGLQTDTIGYTAEELEKVGGAKKNVVKAAQTAKVLYEAIAINQLGWINCDRFYDNENLSNLVVELDKESDMKSAALFLVFKDINSVMNESWFFDKPEVTFRNIPVDSKVKLIAVGIKDGKTFSHTEELTIKPNDVRNIKLKEVSEGELERLFSFP